MGEQRTKEERTVSKGWVVENSFGKVMSELGLVDVLPGAKWVKVGRQGVWASRGAAWVTCELRAAPSSALGAVES